jgi:hypothetical protein
MSPWVLSSILIQRGECSDGPKFSDYSLRKRDLYFYKCDSTNATSFLLKAIMLPSYVEVTNNDRDNDFLLVQWVLVITFLHGVKALCNLKGTVQRKLRGVESYINQKDFVSH